MQELEKILEEIEQYISEWEADPKGGYASGFIKGLKKSEKIIRKYLSRENTPKITRSSRGRQCGECSRREIYIKAQEDALKEDGVSKEFLEDCRRTAQKYKRGNKMNVVTVRWFDGYLEEFEATEVRFGCDLLWIRLSNGQNKHIPLRQVRWFGMTEESYQKVDE